MARPVTLFTGQWADLPLADRAGMVGEPQVGPLAGEEGDRSCHLSSLGDVVE